MLVNGDYVIVEFIQHEILESPQEVYNLSVRDYHTYFVTGDGLLVHNSCDTERGRVRQQEADMDNTEKITINGRFRIPDYLNRKTNTMGEAKNVKYLTRSKQLEDMFTYAQLNGYKMFLKIESWTRFSQPLRNMIRQYNAYIRNF